MLDTPTPTPAADKPGDRKAIYNAKKRAERTGTPDPTLVSPKDVREALAAAKDLDDYQRQLDARDIEIDFDRRGSELEIYGCRLRRKGATEWLKASSVHKDLSWPKIAHRFAESNSTKQSPAEQITVPAKTLLAAPAQQRKQLDHPPQQLQQVPQAMYAANQIQQPGPVVKRLGQMSQTLDDMAPAMNTLFLQSAWALSKVAIFCATAAANIAAAVWRFVQKLLALFGLKTNDPLQYAEQPITPQLTYDPVHHGRVLEASELAELDKNAAGAIDHVLECVKLGRPDALPDDVEGRGELIEAMATDAKKGTSAAAEADSLDALFDDHQAAPAPKIEQVLAQPNTFVLLNIAKEEFFTASINKSDAREKETPQVVAARKNHELALRRLKQAKLDYLREKERKGRWAFLLPAEATSTAEEQSEFDQAEKSLANAAQQHPSVVPLALIRKYGDALEKVKAAANVHHAEMLKDVAKFDNAKVKKIALYQAQSFKANFEIFERMPAAGYLDIAVKVAESAPNSIATAQNLAEREAKIQAERQAFLPDDEQADNIDRPGQK